MVRIASPNPDFQELPVPTEDTGYLHPGLRRKNHPIPVAFQVTSPFSRTRVLLPHSLVMHVNPQNLNEAFNQKVERFQTRGGYQEQHWGQELSEISADGNTGAFMNIYTGLTSVLRHRTIAWDRYRDLHDLYLNNGSVYDPFGNIVLQGNVMLMYDLGTYLGTFRSFEVEETDDSPFAFKVSWSFKVEHTIMAVPVNGATSRLIGLAQQGRLQAPTFQSQNVPVSKEATDPNPPVTYEEARQQDIAIEAAEQRRETAPVAPTPGGPSTASSAAEEFGTSEAQADRSAPAPWDRMFGGGEG